jgi:hypothetical protein
LIGSVVGIVLFSNLISIIFKRFHDQTLSLLTGFVFGSLSIIWPWKKELFNFEVLNRHGEPLLIGYERYIPTVWTKSEFVVLGNYDTWRTYNNCCRIISKETIMTTFGLIGYPLEHSFSKKYFEQKFKDENISGVKYTNIETEKLETLFENNLLS